MNNNKLTELENDICIQVPQLNDKKRLVIYDHL